MRPSLLNAGSLHIFCVSLSNMKPLKALYTEIIVNLYHPVVELMKKFCCILLLFTILGTSMSCRKERDNSSILPDVNVDVYIYMNNPSYINLTFVGGWAYVPGGIRGILVYRKSNTEFIAFERNCTYQPNDACATVIVDKSNIMAVDTCCHSEFLLNDGSVLKAPASLPLKVYRNNYDGNVLHIFN